MAARIRVVPITRENWRASLGLGVRPDQQRFVADCVPIAAIVLAKAYVGAGNRTWTPLLIEAGGTPIGVSAICTAIDDPGRECWVFHFFIDEAEQGKGRGRAALEALLDELQARYPACVSVCLTVHPENVPAQRLYESAGFVRTGGEQDGEPVYRLELVSAARSGPGAVVDPGQRE